MKSQTQDVKSVIKTVSTPTPVFSLFPLCPKMQNFMLHVTAVNNFRTPAATCTINPKKINRRLCSLVCFPWLCKHLRKTFAKKPNSSPSFAD